MEPTLEFTEIIRWIAELDLGIIYRGQGLPAISAQVLLILIKRGKTREYLTGEEKAELLIRTNIYARLVVRNRVRGNGTMS